MITSNPATDTPITATMIDAARARRLAYFAQPIDRSTPPAPRQVPSRTRSTSRRRRAIR